MEIQKNSNGFSVLCPECFDFNDSVLCGQFFRYFESEKGFSIISGDKKCVGAKTEGGYDFLTRHADYFINFIDFNYDYAGAAKSLMCFEELVLPISRGSGIRIFNQDLFETIICFIISANNNIPRIKGIIERLCTKAGTKMDGYYAFPTLQQMLPLTELDYREMGAGFRASYLESSVKALAQGALEKIRNREHGALLSLKGVGQKVADCVTLFGLHDFTGYPVDTWIFKANATKELNTPEKVRAHFTNRYGALAGLAQQYIFFYSRSVKKDKK